MVGREGLGVTAPPLSPQSQAAANILGHQILGVVAFLKVQRLPPPLPFYAEGSQRASSAAVHLTRYICICILSPRLRGSPSLPSSLCPLEERLGTKAFSYSFSDGHLY